MKGSDLAFTYGGLTKRELIAAMAMQGLLATPGEYEHAKTIAQWAVDQADALIERLNADPVTEVNDGK